MLQPGRQAHRPRQLVKPTFDFSLSREMTFRLKDSSNPVDWRDRRDVAPACRSSLSPHTEPPPLLLVRWDETEFVAMATCT